MDLPTLILLAGVVAAGLIVIWWYVSRELIGSSGKNAWKSTRSTLSRFGLMRGFKVLSNVKIGDGENAVIVENMLIGYFGVLLVRTLGAKGSYYGTLDGESWSVSLDNKKTPIPNAIRKLKEEEAALRALFSKNKIYKTPLESVVYLNNRSKKTELYITNNGEILAPGKLGGYLNKTKFEKDAGIDVKKLADVVLG